MKALLDAYPLGGLGPRVEMEVKQGNSRVYIHLVLPDDTIAVNGLELWRAVLALMADPEAHRLKDESFVQS